MEDTAFQLLQLGQHQTRSWRGNWMWFLKDWQGCVLTLGASDISEGWQVEQMWILRECAVVMLSTILRSMAQNVA